MYTDDKLMTGLTIWDFCVYWPSQGEPFITETSITRARGGVYSGHTGLIYRGVREGGEGGKGKYIGVWSS